MNLEQALEWAIKGQKVQLPEWGANRYLFYKDGSLYQSWMGIEATIDEQDIKQPWIDREDWLILTTNP